MKNLPHTIDKKTVDVKKAIPHAIHQVWLPCVCVPVCVCVRACVCVLCVMTLYHNHVVDCGCNTNISVLSSALLVSIRGGCARVTQRHPSAWTSHSKPTHY